MLYSGPTGGYDGRGAMPSDMRKLVAGSQAGFTFAVIFGGFFYLGFRADGWLGTSPALTLLGAGVGFVAGFYHLYMTLIGREEAKDQDANAEGNEGHGET